MCSTFMTFSGSLYVPGGSCGSRACQRERKGPRRMSKKHVYRFQEVVGSMYCVRRIGLKRIIRFNT